MATDAHFEEWLSGRSPASPQHQNVSRTPAQRSAGAPGTAYALAALDGECTELSALQPDTCRNHTLNKAVYKCAGFVCTGELDEDHMVAALRAAALESGLPEAEVDATIRSALSGAAKNGVTRTTPASEGIPAAFTLDPNADDLQQTVQQNWDNEVRRRVDQYRLDDEARRVYRALRIRQAGIIPTPGVDLDDFLNVKDEDAVYRIADLLPMGGRALLSAQQKAGKTSLIAALIRSLADETAFLDRYRVQSVQRVSLFDTELDERMLRRWLRQQKIRNRRGRVRVHPLRGKLSTFDFRDPSLRQHWLAELRGSEFVILDCLRPVLDSMGLSEDKDAGQFLVAWDELLNEAGVDGCVVAHHMGHNGERARGDSRLLDWADVNWKIVKESQTSEAVADANGGRRFFSAHGRDVDVAEHLLVLEDGELTLRNGTRASAKTDAARTTLIEILSGGDIGDGLTRNQLRDRLGDSGISDHTARGVIKQAVRDGIVVQIEGPNRSQLHFLHPSVGDR
ncbi:MULTISPECIES: AAA family ATPase [Mycobacterium]|uniref:AAA family ATPase n=1 Tax=Mycobacterium TaxID=1763 RepID=UPI00106FAFBE|nr:MULTISPECIES: AAA family ATPase [Mycobacterium]UQB90884.1 AAA family ATPase [Mycobacterium intracellulare]WSE48425.1 AAA family ATPase [Mycobacterium sp. 3-98]